MENNKEHHIERTNFDAFVHAVGSEIEQAQVRLITAANAQMLFHYWKIGNYILYHQNLQGWGSKIIKQLAKAIRLNYPEKKGYSERNLTYMCQFARSYPLNVLRSFIDTDARLSVPSIQKVADEVLKLNNGQFTQELTAQIQSTDSQLLEFTQEPLAQIQNVAKTVSAIYRITIEDIEKLFLASPVARINWASHVIMLNNSLPLGVKYWYMKQSVEMGWSSNVLKIQIETNLYNRQISNNKVNNFTATLPAPQSDLANYLLKDPYIFDLAGAKEKADERDIEEQLVKHVTRYLLEMGNGFAFVARQKHFQIGNSDFFADLILYSIPLHAYIVVELKATPFKPEYAGQLNFYINVVDDKLRGENDNKTIGLLLCKGKDEVVAQYALTGYDQPIGISDYQLSKAIPENLKSALPSVEEVEEELASFLDKDNNPQKHKEQYTLILNSLKIEIEKNIRAYETKPLNDDIIKRVCFHYADRRNSAIRDQLEITTKLHEPLNDAYHRYDFIGFREHTDEEEIQAEKEYERCKAEYDKEKNEYFDMKPLSPIYETCVGEQFEAITIADFYANINLYPCKNRLKIKAREKIRVCYLIFLMSEKLSKQYRDEWRDKILKLLDIDESYYRSKYKEPVSDFPSDSNQKFAKEMESIFR